MEVSIKAKRAEIALRYKRRGRPDISALRLRDLSELFARRYGHEWPDTETARADLVVIAHHLAALPGDPRKRVLSWLKGKASWLSLKDADELLGDAIMKPRRWRADKLAWRLKLIEEDRKACRITTIGAIDLSRNQRAARRREAKRLAKEVKRRAAGAKPRAEYLAAARSSKPWLALGMSRASWFRRGKPAA